MASLESAWTLDERQDWLPPGYPRPPISPSLYESLRECRLRANFQCSSPERYRKRSTPAARIGTAFHQTLEELARVPSDGSQMDMPAFCERGLAIFREQLAIQRTESAGKPRECHLSWPDDRLGRAEDAVIVMARRLWLDGQHRERSQPMSGSACRTGPAVERRLESRDSLLVGIVDRVEMIDGRRRIIDYKTSLSADEGAHARQIKLYAYLWFDHYDTWPDDGLLIYVLLRREIPVIIEPAECVSLADEVRQEALGLMRARVAPDRLASPGPVCIRCQFRPWCRPFWDAQAKPADEYTVVERARAGFAGVVSRTQAAGGVLLLELVAIGRIVELRLPISQFAHLTGVQAGDRLRVLDTRLTGVVGRPTADVTERTEIYRVLDASAKNI
jgi:RecB family exonuclease